jgi:DNA-binding transcriptional LysR family regulator
MQISHRTILQLNFQHLRTFLTLAHVENFSRAGEQVGLSQSAVSRHIRALEDSLGLKLFERIGRRAVLTSAGRILQARMEALMREADMLPRVLKDLSEGIQGDIRIGACITAANALLPQVLGLYRQKYPDVGLALQPGNSAGIVENLRRGEIDIAFIASDRLPSDVTIVAEIPDELVLFAAPNHQMSLRRGLKPQDLSDCDFIQRETPSDTHAMVSHWLEAEGIEVRNLMDVW